MHTTTKLDRTCFSDSRRFACPRNLATMALLVLSTLGYSQLVDSTTAKGIYPTNGAASIAGATAAMMYHGGPVMTGTPNIHYLFYGSWTSTQMNLLNHFATYLGGSAYYNILTWYNNPDPISNSLADGASVTVPTLYGTVLTDADVQDIVSRVIAQDGVDKNGIYLVLSAANIQQGTASGRGRGGATNVVGSCNQYCGWHSYFTYNNASVVKYGWIGDPAACPLIVPQHQTNKTPRTATSA